MIGGHVVDRHLFPPESLIGCFVVDRHLLVACVVVIRRLEFLGLWTLSKSISRSPSRSESDIEESTSVNSSTVNGAMAKLAGELMRRRAGENEQSGRLNGEEWRRMTRRSCSGSGSGYYIRLPLRWGK